MTHTFAARLGAALLWVSGVGCGIPCLMAIRELRAGRGIAFVFGYPAYGQGPFERHGYLTTVPLVSGFLVICLAEVAAGLLLWNGYRAGAILTFVLLPLGAVYWWGFALPFPPLIALVRLVFIAAAWQGLR